MDIDRKSVFYCIDIGCYCQACIYTYITNGDNIKATKKGLKHFIPKDAIQLGQSVPAALFVTWQPQRTLSRTANQTRLARYEE